jgi:hypothetical protein
MKQGRTLQDLATELDRQKEAKRDFIVDTRQAQVVPVEHQEKNAKWLNMILPVATENGETKAEQFEMNPHALRQVGQRLKIPAKFVDRLASDYPDMLAYNINGLFSREPEKRMIRTLDGNVRAFLSDRFRIMDNFDLLEAILPGLVAANADIISCEVTERNLFVKAIHPTLTAAIPPPPGVAMGDGKHTFFVDNVQAGLTIRNSEIGQGRLGVQPASFTARCTNFMSFKDYEYSKFHLGSRHDGGGKEAWEMFSDETKQLSDAALWNQVKDIVTAAMDGTAFEKIVQKLTVARTDDISQDPVKCVEILSDKNGLGEDDKVGILQHLIRGGELTRYGLSNAVTRHAEDVESYDTATQLEALGGTIIELPKSDWTVYAKAA